MIWKWCLPTNGVTCFAHVNVAYAKLICVTCGENKRKRKKERSLRRGWIFHDYFGQGFDYSKIILTFLGDFMQCHFLWIMIDCWFILPLSWLCLIGSSVWYCWLLHHYLGILQWEPDNILPAFVFFVWSLLTLEWGKNQDIYVLNSQKLHKKLVLQLCFLRKVAWLWKTALCFWKQ